MISADPWGPLDWVLARAPVFASSVLCLGAVGPEDRCVTVPMAIGAGGRSILALLRISDPPSTHTKRIKEKTEANRRRLEGRRFDVYDLNLLDPDQKIFDALETAKKTAAMYESVCLDITCLPKRYFCFLLKLLVKDVAVRNILVTYTQPGPGGYASPHLSEDPDEVRALPGFAPMGEPTALVVSVGFESLGLPQFLSEYRHNRRRVVVLLPFPPGQPYAQRTWQALHRLGISESGGDLRRVAALDAFDVVRQLRAIEAAERSTGSADEPVMLALAPYGPKPISVGMALYAIESGAPMLYTQPRLYHPDYSDGSGPTWGFVVKRQGKLFSAS